jgi:hypothetical protein
MELKGKRMLSVATLEVLPIRDTEFPVPSIFRPLFDAVADAFREHSLLPAHSGGSVVSSRAKLGRGGDLLEIVSDGQLSLAFKKDQLCWVSGQITENRTHDLWHYLRHTLGVEELRVDEFCRQMDVAFFQAQSDEWVAKFYVFLCDEDRAGLWKYPQSPLRGKPFLRLETGGHVAPPVPSEVAKVFLPSEQQLGFPTVKCNLCTTPAIMAFLRALGLAEPDLVDEVVQQILPNYESGAVDINDGPRLRRDLVRILEALKGAKSKGAVAFLGQLEQTPFVRAVNIGSGELAWKQPRNLYFRGAELEMYFAGNSGAWFLNTVYAQHHQQLAVLGINSSVCVSFRQPDWNGDVAITHQHSWHERGLNGIDPGCQIDGLEHALRTPAEDRSRFIWNRLLKEHIKQICGVVESSSRQTYEASKKNPVTSVMGELVSGYAWLPSRVCGWHKPSELGIEDLPDGFEPSESLAEKLGMRSSALGQLARQKNVPLEKIQILFDHLNDPEIQRFIAKKEKNIVSPPSGPAFESPARSGGGTATLTQPRSTLEKLAEAFVAPGATALDVVNLLPGTLRNPERYRRELKDQLKERKDSERPREQRQGLNFAEYGRTRSPTSASFSHRPTTGNARSRTRRFRSEMANRILKFGI